MARRLILNGRLAACVLVTWSVPVARVAHLVPGPLRLTTRADRAFWNLVVCRVEALRPRGVPALLGVSYLHVAHRLHVHVDEADGSRTEGLFFVRSDVDHALVAGLGNRMTDLRMHTASIRLEAGNGVECARVVDTSDGRGELELELGPASSEARDDLEAPPYVARALAWDPARQCVRRLEVERDPTRWRERPREVLHERSRTFEELELEDRVLVRSVSVDPIDYRWRLGS